MTDVTSNQQLTATASEPLIMLASSELHNRPRTDITTPPSESWRYLLSMALLMGWETETLIDCLKKPLTRWLGSMETDTNITSGSLCLGWSTWRH
jgi:hypothetical protein